MTNVSFVTCHAAVRYIDRVLGLGAAVKALQDQGMRDAEILQYAEDKAGLERGAIIRHIEANSELASAAKAKVSRMARGDWVYIFKAGKLVTIINADGYSRPGGREGLNSAD